MFFGVIILVFLIVMVFSPERGSNVASFHPENEQLYFQMDRRYNSDSACVYLGRSQEELRLKKDYFVVKVDFGRDAIRTSTPFFVRNSCDSVFVLDPYSSVHGTNFNIVKMEERFQDKWYLSHKEDYHSFYIDWFNLKYITHENSYSHFCQIVLWPE